MMLLVNTPTGQQEVIEIGEGGGYFDTARVLWDERFDGPLPEITLGGMVRIGGALQFRQVRMDETTAALEPTPTIPASVTRRQGLQALFLAGITEAMIEAKVIELLEGDARELALIEFRTSQTFERGRPLVLQMGAVFGLDLDAIFVTASSIP